MKKSTLIGSALAVVFTAGALTIPVFAVSDPADDTDGYSCNNGLQSYETRMAEEHPWYDNEDETVTDDYSFHAGSQASQSRHNTFAGIPSGDEVTKEEIEAWFADNGIGEGAARTDGAYDEAAKGSYAYAKGQASYQERHAVFDENC